MSKTSKVSQKPWDVIAERTVILGNAATVETTHANEFKSYRLKTDDDTFVDCIIADNVGRQTPMKLPSSTILVMVGTEPAGAFQFDKIDNPKGKDGQTLFVQRPSLSRAEVFTMIEEIILKNKTIIVPPTEKERRLIV